MAYDKEQFKTECDRRRNESLIVKGNTYPIKDMIKQLGGIWDSMNKQWLMPDQGSVDACTAEMNGESPAAQPEQQATRPQAPQASTEMPDMPF